MVEFNPLIAGNAPEANPLHKFFRQPKVYTTLPSKGQYYAPGVLDMPETGELPVFAMTAKDELTMKTPDALLNGQATVDVIKSCVPNIKDPWKMPSLDLDAILIAIRIATYGEKLEITTKVPVTGAERSYQIDLRQVLSKLVTVDFEGSLTIDNMLVKVRPLTYAEFTKSNLKTFEEQRVFSLVNDEQMPDEEKLIKFNDSFRKLTDLTVDMLGRSVYSITVDETEVTNETHIQEFLQNSDKNFFNSILEFLEEEKKKFAIEPMKVNSSDEDMSEGAPSSFEVPITFDQSNFFA
mgnify:CR=1 FL=1